MIDLPQALFNLTQEIIKNPDITFLLLVVILMSLAASGGLWIYKFQPAWAITRHQITTSKLDRLHEAYKEYRSSGEGLHDKSAAAFRFEGSLQHYCKTSVHHCVGDMALRADSPTRALDDLRKDSKLITHRNGVFQQTIKPYSFPSSKDHSKKRKIALLFYIIFCFTAGVPFIIGMSDHLAFEVGILAAFSMSYFPGMLCIEFIRSSNRSGRLYRLSETIRANGGKLYGETEDKDKQSP